MLKRYLVNWDYNAALIFDHLEKIVHDNGGILVSEWAYKYPRKEYLIVNRSITSAIREQKERIERVERISKKPAASSIIADLEALEAMDNEPKFSHYGEYRYIQFYLNETYFYYSVDNNPFFTFHYSKSAAPNFQIDRNAYHYEDKKEWLYDCFFSWSCSDADRKEAANMIFNMLMNAPMCKSVRPARPATLRPLIGESV